MSEVEIIVDGSCLGNPGPGGWACILRCGVRERVLQGGEPNSTNNRMELTAAIEGLRALSRPCGVTVRTDSDYLRRGITEFLPRWTENQWRNSGGKPVANQDLWEQLEELTRYHDVKWLQVRGHSGQPDQDRCDALATAAARIVKQERIVRVLELRTPDAGCRTWTAKRSNSSSGGDSSARRSCPTEGPGCGIVHCVDGVESDM